MTLSTPIRVRRDSTAQNWRMSDLVALVRQAATTTRLAEEECHQIDLGVPLRLAEMQEASAGECRRGRLREPSWSCWSNVARSRGELC